MGVGLLVGVWVARYLGPERFGLFNYAIAFVALFTSIATLGLNGIVVRDVIREPREAEVTLGTAFFLQIIGGFCALALALIAVSYAKPEDSLVKVMVAVLGGTGLLKATEVIKYWFESKVQSRSIVWLENGIFLVVSVVKVVMILSQAPLLAFVWLVLVEVVLVSIGLVFVYRFHGYSIRKWRWRYQRAKSLLEDSWPLVLSGLAAMIYMRIDQVMLGDILGQSEVGLFSAAVRITEIGYMIPTMIVGSVFPAILKAKQNSEMLYQGRLKRLFELLTIMAVGLALPVSFMSDWIIQILYGENYSAAADVLAIQIWASVFVFSGIASSRWFLVENLQRYSFYRTLAGAVINIALNYFLIPNYGVVGAAWATLISQAVASVLFNVLSRDTRPLFYMQVSAIFGIGLLKK